MTLSTTTTALLVTLDSASRGQLKRRGDLGILLDLGADPARAVALDDLAFRAKFLTRTFGIMQRIGREGNGYDRLESEFAVSMDVARRPRAYAPRRRPGRCPRPHDRRAYLAMTPDGLGNLLALLGDLMWYKNWLLDSKQAHA